MTDEVADELHQPGEALPRRIYSEGRVSPDPATGEVEPHQTRFGLARVEPHRPRLRLDLARYSEGEPRLATGEVASGWQGQGRPRLPMVRLSFIEDLVAKSKNRKKNSKNYKKINEIYLRQCRCAT